MNSEVRTAHRPRIQVLFDPVPPTSVPRAPFADVLADPATSPGLREAVEALNRLIGLDRVKWVLYGVYAYLTVGQRRLEAGLKAQRQTLHMVFRGNPGTGKTTVARLVGRLLHEMGVLAKGHLVEAERADLVGEYIGHTAQRTREHIKKALGGVLFIDEAYSLARGGEKDFGKEAIDTLVKAMEDHRDEFVLILAGYPQEMDAFLRVNPGLPSRFPIQLTFPDYTVDELLAIADQMVRDHDYALSPTARLKLKRMIVRAMDHPAGGFSNARFVRNVLERAFRRQALRLLHKSPVTRDELMTLLPEDLEVAEVRDIW